MMPSSPSSSPSQVMLALASRKAWDEAVQHFHKNLGPEASIINDSLLMHWKSGASIVDVLLDSFQIMHPSVERQWLKARKTLAIVLNTLITLDKKIAAWISISDGNAIFVAFDALLKATNGLSDGSDRIEMLQELLDKFLELFQGLEICTRRQTMSLNDTYILVKIFAELLNVVNLSIKAFRKNDGSWKKVLESGEVENALTRLEKLVKAELLAPLKSTVWTSVNSNVAMINRTVSDMGTRPAVISIDTTPVTSTAQIFPNAHQLDINGGTYSSVARDQINQIINIHPSLPVTTTIPISHPLNGSCMNVNRGLVFIASYVYHVRAIVDCRLPNMQDKLIALSAMLGCILTAPGVSSSIKLNFNQVFMFMVFGFTFVDRVLMPAEVITVIDVYGGCFCIPLEHGRDWTRLNREILHWFGSKPQLHKALGYLRRRLYQLQDFSQEGQVFDESNWRPGSGMIIEIAIILSWDIGPTFPCPRCSAFIPYNTKASSQSNLKCLKCYTSLSTSDATGTPSLPLESQQATMDGNQDYIELNDMRAGDEPKEIDFRKLHLTHSLNLNFPATVDLSESVEEADDARGSTSDNMVPSLAEEDTTYPPVMKPLLQSLSLLRSAAHENRITHFQPSTSCILSSVRSIFSVTDTLLKESPTLQQFPILADERRLILSVLASLVIQSKRSSDETLAEDSREIEVQAMLSLAQQVSTLVYRFLAIAFQCGIELPTSRDSSSPVSSLGSMLTPPPLVLSGPCTMVQVLQALQSTHNLPHLSAKAVFGEKSSMGQTYDLVRKIVERYCKLLTSVEAVLQHPDVPNYRLESLKVAHDQLYRITSGLAESGRLLTAPQKVSDEEENKILLRCATALEAGSNLVSSIKVCLNCSLGEPPFILKVPLHLGGAHQ